MKNEEWNGEGCGHRLINLARSVTQAGIGTRVFGWCQECQRQMWSGPKNTEGNEGNEEAREFLKERA